MQIVMSFLMLTMVAVMLPRAGVAADRIDEVLTTEPAIHDPVPEAIPADLNQHHWNGEVAFHHVNFTYPGSSEDALHDIVCQQTRPDHGHYRLHRLRQNQFAAFDHPFL